MTIAPQDKFNSNKPWPDGAIEDWQAGASYAWIERKYGRGYSTIAKLIRRVKIKGVTRTIDLADRRRKGGRTPFHQQRPIGPIHAHIGIQIGRYREIEHSYTAAEFGQLVNSNQLAIRSMELGLHDFTLSEMLRFASLLEVPLNTLIGPLGDTSGAKGDVKRV